MLTSAYLCVLVLSQVGETPPNSPDPFAFVPNKIRITQTHTGRDLSWADAEDTLTGSITPSALMEGLPLTVSVKVGSFQGTEFDGPVRIALRADGQPTMEQLVQRDKGDKTWLAKFTPTVEGHHTLEVSFRTTHNKVLAADFEVQGGRMPRWPWYVLGVAITLGGVGIGLRQALKKGG